MLPVASPQHDANGYYRLDSRQQLGPDPYDYDDEGGVYQDMYQQGGPQYPQQPTSDGMTVDLESFKLQKIQEFREALEKDLERKRQQAQRELEEAEMLRQQQLEEYQQELERRRQQAQRALEEAEQLQRQQLEEFQFTLQGELQQTQAQMPRNAYEQLSAMERHRMSLLAEQQQRYQRPNTPSNSMHYNDTMPQHHMMSSSSSYTPTISTMPQHLRQQAVRFAPPSPGGPLYNSSPNYVQQQQRMPSSYPPPGIPPPIRTASSGYYPGPGMGYQDEDTNRGDIWRNRGPAPPPAADYFTFDEFGNPTPRSQQQPQQHYHNNNNGTPGITGAGSAAAAMMERTASYQQRSYEAMNRQRMVPPSPTWAAPSSPSRRMESPIRGGAASRPYSSNEWEPSSPVRRGESPLRGATGRPNGWPSSPVRGGGIRPSEWAPSSPQQRAGGSPIRTRPPAWTPSSPQRTEPPYRGNTPPQQPSKGDQTPTRERTEGKPQFGTGGSEIIDQADELEREYARLTGKPSTTTREKALAQIKQIQEERRRKLEAITKRVVQNRRKFAHEVKVADRPLEITFQERREEVDIRDDDEGREVEDVVLEGILEETEVESETQEHDGGTRRVEVRSYYNGGSNPTSEISERRNDSRGHDAYHRNERGITPIGNGESSSSKFAKLADERKPKTESRRYHDDHARDSAKHTAKQAVPPSRNEKSVADSSSREKSKAKEKKPKEKHAKESAREFVEKLRQKRFQAREMPVREESAREEPAREEPPKEQPADYDVQQTYSRQDTLTSLEADRKTVAITSRDPRLASHNRKQSSQKVVEKQQRESVASRGRSGKVAAKKPITNSRPMNRGTADRKEKEVKERVATKDRSGEDAVKIPVSNSRPITNEATIERKDREVKENATARDHSGQVGAKKTVTNSRPIKRDTTERKEMEVNHDLSPIQEGKRAQDTQNEESVDDPEPILPVNNPYLDNGNPFFRKDDQPVSENPQTTRNTPPRRKDSVKERLDDISRNLGTVSTRKKKNTRGSSAISYISDITDSVRDGATSYTGSGVFKKTISEHSEDSGHDEMKDEESEEPETTTEDDDLVNFLSGSGDTDEEPSDSMSLTSDSLAGYFTDTDERNKDKKKKIKVRPLTADSVAEGFEIEEGFDLLSLYSRSVYSKNSKREDKKEADDEMKMNTLTELEKNLDEKDFKNIVPELVDFTESHGWDVRDVFKHFGLIFPQLSSDGASRGFMPQDNLARLPASHAPATPKPDSQPPNNTGNHQILKKSATPTPPLSTSKRNASQESPPSPILLPNLKTHSPKHTDAVPHSAQISKATSSKHRSTSPPSPPRPSRLSASSRTHTAPPSPDSRPTSPARFPRQTAPAQFLKPTSKPPPKPKDSPLPQPQLQAKKDEKQQSADGWRARVQRLKAHGDEAENIDMGSVRDSLRLLSRKSRQSGGSRRSDR